ncbi:MAG: cellulose biosynthesis cyclic di-GMP-binding regulatory protein BcsB [Proteobacteria bacterium]|nr:cellulose biosynthesis cyclic di-GMP-binding regulatory protein BcsB [Pseudomonadota bacterium]
MVTSAVAIAAASTVAFGAEAQETQAVRAPASAGAAVQGSFRPYLERSFALSDLNFANPLIFSGAEFGQQIFFAIPRDVSVHDVAIDIEGNYLRSDLGHSVLVASVNDIPGFSIEPKDASGAFTRTINVPESQLADPFVKLDLRYSSIVSEDRCTEQRSIANVITVSPKSKLRYRVNADDVKDVRSAWGMLPSRPTILIPAGAIDETHYAAALKLALAMSAAGHQPQIVTAPVVGDTVDVSGLKVPAALTRIAAFRIFEGQEKVTLANQAERGAYALLSVLHGHALGEVAIGSKWLAAQTKADMAALTAEAERAGPNAARALAGLLADLPSTAIGGVDDNLTLETILGQPVITLANDASRAASLLATQWSRLANAEGLDVAFAGSEPVDMNAIQLGEFGGNLAAQSIIQYGDWVTAFDAAQLPPGRWPSNIELEMRVSPDASDVAPLVTIMLNDVLLRAEKVDPNSETVRINADVPPYLLASRNTLRISLQRGPSSGDCRTLNRGYLAQILPTSRLVLGNETIDGQFFGLKSKLANGALIAVPKAYLETPTESLPYVFQFLRELKVNSSSIRLRTVDDAASYRPEGTFVSFGVPLPGKRKNLQVADNSMLLTDETGLPIANIKGARDAAVVQIVSLGEVTGLSVNSTTGKPIPGIQVNDLGEGDVAIYDASGRIGDLGAGDFRMAEIKRALLSPSALFHRYSIWIMTGIGVLLAMLVMSATRAFVVARKRHRAEAKAEQADD